MLPVYFRAVATQARGPVCRWTIAPAGAGRDAAHASADGGIASMIGVCSGTQGPSRRTNGRRGGRSRAVDAGGSREARPDRRCRLNQPSTAMPARTARSRAASAAARCVCRGRPSSTCRGSRSAHPVRGRRRRATPGGHTSGMSLFGSWCLAYAVALMMNDASTTRLSSALARRYGKSTANVASGLRS